MNNKKLDWKHLIPDLSKFASIFDKKCKPFRDPLSVLQPRLISGLAQICQPCPPSYFMCLNAQEKDEYFQLIYEAVKKMLPPLSKAVGSIYLISDTGDIQEQPANKIGDNFAATDTCIWQAWVEYESLFGAIHCYRDTINLRPGLVHRANGGVLIIGARALINQPLLWLRLKQIILQKRFDWLSKNANKTLPIFIPSMSLNLRLILICDSTTITELNILEPYINSLFIYSEFESELSIANIQDMTKWCSWVNTLAEYNKLPLIRSDAWPILVQQAIRYTEDQFMLPLCPSWIIRRLKETAICSHHQTLTVTDFNNSNLDRIWRENYLNDYIRNEIISGQIRVETDGQVVGQVNALSILCFPGHPLSFGIPLRVSCVIHYGEGDIKDVDRKVELGGNLHAKSMLIMQAFLMSMLNLDQQLPFSVSLVFEQSYDEVDGDSASLAGGAALISALANKPVNQQIAVTGSLDQFGHVQSIGDINKKIESFFALCKERSLTGTQGVILPLSNVRHLCLNNDIINAVRNGKFSLWAVETVNEALEILTGVPFHHSKRTDLISEIRNRIVKINMRERNRIPRCLRWLNYFRN